ncbi:MAG: L-2-amino-thiazoline-4-carboxylic acid hydrolase [Gemmatimonadota bacterium]|nr:MAG: L-2-amino-thiazoline-4-carboxylic acid hydrolase [Gemmatimonadota bacterium]
MLTKRTFLELDRRQFLSKIMPACALTCFGLGSTVALGQDAEESTPLEDVHKFDEEFGRKLTYRQYFVARYGEFIQLAKALEKELGEEKTIQFLKEYTTEKMLQYGKSHASKSPDNGFHTYTDTFRDPERYKNTATMEIIEDTERAFELKVTECLWATSFLDADAGEIGYASVCYGDYAWAEGFNPKIGLIRDKTLMQGHGYCNHRYILKV